MSTTCNLEHSRKNLFQQQLKLRLPKMSALVNSLVVVTGANRGIGLEVSKQFACKQWTVVMCGRNENDIEVLFYDIFV